MFPRDSVTSSILKSKWLLSFIFIGLFVGCRQNQSTHKNNDKNIAPRISIIPKPVSVSPKNGSYQLKNNTTIQIPANSKKSRWAAEFLKDKLHASTSFFIHIKTSASSNHTGDIIFTLAPDTSGFGNNEGYKLTVTPQQVTITAPMPHGLFNGVQSLLQLFSPQIYQTDYTLVPQNTTWTIPAAKIRDYPRFKYRGMHLDVSRHFFGVKLIKQYIDLLAMYKLNRFHWHLTDDQGWRIQIKQYPKLTKIGAWRDSTALYRSYSNGQIQRYDHHPSGGFYTQKEIKEVVNYAKKRFITIIPEIEMPGHSAAAIAAYPKLGCKPPEGFHGQSVWGADVTNVYCPSDYTFNFLENVLTEVMKLFPSKYIHIGGDEVDKKFWKKSKLAQKVMKQKGLKNAKQLQSYFIKRIETFVNDHGRKIIGWDEILEGGLAPNAIVESWRGIQGGVAAAMQHHKVIMAPYMHYYFDHAQGNPKTEPIALNYGGINPLQDVYTFNPIPDTLSAEDAQYIYGVEGGVWTEVMASPRKVEYMVLPRLLALSETAWTPKGKKSWNAFWKRLQLQFKRFEVLDVDYGKQYKGQKPHIKQYKKK